MPAQWTGDIVATMHINGITRRQLAEHLGYSPEWVTLVLNGHKEPAGAEAKFRAALDELIQEKTV